MRFQRICCAALSALLFMGMISFPEGSFLAKGENPERETMSQETRRPEGESAPAEEMPAALADVFPEPPSLDWLEEKGLSLGESQVVYPSLREGILPEEIRAAVNERILEDGQIREYVTRVSQLISGGKLQVSWRGTMMGPVFSFAVSAEGAVSMARPTHVWTGGNIDLRTGEEVTFQDLFSDPDAAVERMETYLEEEVTPDFSAHLASSEVTPLPEYFRMNERGLVLMYPIDRLSTLSDRAGDVLIPWGVLREELNAAEDGLPVAMGVWTWMDAGTDRGGQDSARREAWRERLAEALRQMTAAGAMPGIPLGLGDSVQELTEKWHLLTDPDVYVNGRMFALEGAECQKVYLLTDFLSERWENSVVDGIRMDLGGVYGLEIGVTRQENWREMLGAPDYMIEMNEEMAEAYRAEPGVRDYYAFGGHRLQLHADENGILRSVILAE